jgi:alkanesulfonate monooxygenase SsuD/methylene tetrahydromethanopterin reductase-like flavin-dependent oxidoreductase (luciferase family)
MARRFIVLLLHLLFAIILIGAIPVWIIGYLVTGEDFAARFADSWFSFTEKIERP